MKRVHLVHPNSRAINLVVGGGTCLFEFKDSMIQISLLIKTKEEYKHTENTLPFLLVESNDCSLEKPSKPPIKATEQRPNKKVVGGPVVTVFFQTFVFVAQTLSTLLKTRNFISK